MDFSLLTSEQKQILETMYNRFLVENKKLEKRRLERLSSTVSIKELQTFLFNNRNQEFDCYLDLDNKKYPSSYVNDDDFKIYTYRDREYIADFTIEEFIPACDHLPEEILDELNAEVTNSVGGNYSRWSDIHKEKEKNPSSLLGYHTLENGFTFYGMYGTNDGAWSVFFIVYLDENGHLRGYIPKEGNQYCHDSNEAWGWDCSLFEDEDFREEKEEELYNLMEKGIYFDYEQIKEDILKNIKIV